jgi:ATPase family AAA domain-containing protein 3A/B
MFSGFNGFGGGKSSEDVADTIATNSKKSEPTPSPKDSGSSKSVHGFDPNALERAARAAKDLDTSKNAREALRLITLQEVTKQKENEMERAKYQAMQQELAIRRVKEEEEAGARTLDRQTQHENSRSDYKDSLERKRMADNISTQRRLQEEERKKTEDSLKRQAEIRKKTLEYEAELRQQTEMARVRAETDGRIMQERKNHDLVVDSKRVEAKEYRETVMEGIKLAGSTFGSGFTELISDREKLVNISSTITALAFGIYTARVSTIIAGRYIEARLGKPSLVRETTKKNFLQMIRSPLQTAQLAFKSVKGKSFLL